MRNKWKNLRKEMEKPEEENKYLNEKWNKEKLKNQKKYI